MVAARPSKKHYIQQKNAAPENSIEIIHFLFESCQEQQSSMYRQVTFFILRRSKFEQLFQSYIATGQCRIKTNSP